MLCFRAHRKSGNNNITKVFYVVCGWAANEVGLTNLLALEIILFSAQRAICSASTDIGFIIICRVAERIWSPVYVTMPPLDSCYIYTENSVVSLTKSVMEQKTLTESTFSCTDYNILTMLFSQRYTRRRPKRWVDKISFLESRRLERTVSQCYNNAIQRRYVFSSINCPLNTPNSVSHNCWNCIYASHIVKLFNHGEFSTPSAQFQGS